MNVCKCSFVEDEIESCRSSGLAPPNCIWWYFVFCLTTLNVRKCLFVVALCRSRYCRVFASFRRCAVSPVRRRVVVFNAPPHCVPWYCLAILSFCLAYKKKQETEKIYSTSSSKHDLPGSFGDLSRPASLTF